MPDIVIGSKLISEKKNFSLPIQSYVCDDRSQIANVALAPGISDLSAPRFF